MPTTTEKETEKNSSGEFVDLSNLNNESNGIGTTTPYSRMVKKLKESGETTMLPDSRGHVPFYG